jgi:hypothetical protein
MPVSKRVAYMKYFFVKPFLLACFILSIPVISCKVKVPAEGNSVPSSDPSPPLSGGVNTSPGSIMVEGYLVLPGQNTTDSFPRLRIEEIISFSSGLSNFLSAGDTIILRSFKFSEGVRDPEKGEVNRRLRLILQEQLSIDPEGVVYSVKDVREAN